MLSRLFFEQKESGANLAVVTGDGSVTWAELRDLAGSIASTHWSLSRRRVGLSFQSPAASYAALAALDRLECDVFLFSGDRPIANLLSAATHLCLGCLVVPKMDGLELHALENEAAWSGERSITILTSGSSGAPKAARHSWESISRPVKVTQNVANPTWMLTYQPNLYAGLQVMLQCFADRGTLVIPGRDLDPAGITEFLIEHSVQFVSATPSYWRRLLMFGAPERLGRAPLRQITLGGEAADQPTLDRLRKCFPDARLVHIYATTETGRCFAVSDGLAGFPASYLTAPLADGTEIQIVEGELQVRSVNAMRGYDVLSSVHGDATGWFKTGDLVELHGDRVLFAGRKTDMINVAGSKVYPLEVEQVIRSVPGVSDVRVYGKASSIAGELVACEIVPAPGEESALLRTRVAQVCRQNLTTYQQPRLILMVPHIELSAAGKTLRVAH